MIQTQAWWPGSKFLQFIRTFLFTTMFKIGQELTQPQIQSLLGGFCPELSEQRKWLIMCVHIVLRVKV